MADLEVAVKMAGYGIKYSPQIDYWMLYDLKPPHNTYLVYPDKNEFIEKVLSYLGQLTRE